MPTSTIASFGTPAEFEVALQQECGVELLVTGQGPFRAQLMRIALPHLCLLHGEEWLPRIAFVTAAPDTTILILPTQQETLQRWGGVSLPVDEIMTVSACECLHVRADGPSHWAAIRVSAKELSRIGRVLVGPEFALPPGIHRWRPMRSSI